MYRKKLIEEISEETLLTSILLIGNLTIDFFKSARILGIPFQRASTIPTGFVLVIGVESFKRSTIPTNVDE